MRARADLIMKQFGFYFATHPGDNHLAVRLARQITSHHPGLPIAVTFDGSPGRGVCAILQQLGCRVFPSRPMKRWQDGGKGAERNYSNALTLGADVLIQLDPDSYLHRPLPLETAPDAPWFGKLLEVKANPQPRAFTTLHGACWGIAADSLQQIIDSGLLQDPLYRGENKSDGTWAFNTPYGWRASHDLITGDVAGRIGIKPQEWVEVAGGLKNYQEFFPQPSQWPVTHPVKASH